MEKQKRTDIKDGTEIRNRLLKDSPVFSKLSEHKIKFHLEIKQIKQTG